MGRHLAYAALAGESKSYEAILVGMEEELVHRWMEEKLVHRGMEEELVHKGMEEELVHKGMDRRSEGENWRQLMNGDRSTPRHERQAICNAMCGGSRQDSGVTTPRFL